MREIASSDAKTQLPEILDAVERGESFVIMRRGRPVARIVPEPDRQSIEVRRTIERLEAFRKTMPSMTLDEFLSARHEGHKY